MRIGGWDPEEVRNLFAFLAYVGRELPGQTMKAGI